MKNMKKDKKTCYLQSLKVLCRFFFANTKLSLESEERRFFNEISSYLEKTLKELSNQMKLLT